MVADMISDRAMIGELERAGTEPSAITLRPAPDVAAPAHMAGHRDSLGQRVLVLQGGGALGAYQVGVYQALHEAGIEPDWVVGTSIGAINASLIAGSEPADRLDRLEEFWCRVEHGPLQRLVGAMPMFGAAGRQHAHHRRPAFRPSSSPIRWPSSARTCRSGADAAGYYDTAQLRATLSELVDFDRINRRADPADGRRRQCRHRRDALLRQPRPWRSTSAT